MSKKIAVDIINVTKTFKTPLESSSGLKQKIINLTKGIKGYKTLTPLKNVSLQVEEGDFFGIVGRNGSGKSTLLKTIAGVYTPDSGQVVVNGKLVPFIELGVGFSPDLSGRENVFLNGALLGFSREEMEEMYDDIVDFAELHDFMGERLKNYSSGMQVRLAFSIAIRAKGDILLLDEVLAVGDEAFQRKCYAYFAELKRKKKTVILVTHSMESIQQFCNKAALIDKGHEALVGSPVEISKIYKELNMPTSETVSTKGGGLSTNTKNDYVNVRGESNITSQVVELDFDIMPKVEVEDASVAITINNGNGDMIYRWVTEEHINRNIKLVPGREVNLTLSLQNIFPEGGYSVRIAVRKRDKSFDYINAFDVVKFDIAWSTNNAGFWKPEESFFTQGV